MALQSLPGLLAWPGMCNIIGSSAPSVTTTATLDAAGEYQTFIFKASQSMNISYVGVVPATVSGSPVLDLRIETVDGATGLPTGTLWNSGGTNDSVRTTGTLVANTMDVGALTGATGTINPGDYVAVKLLYNSGTSVVPARLNQFNVTTSIPYLATNTGTPAKATSQSPQCILLGSASNTFYYVPGLAPAQTASNNTFNNTSSAKRGMRFQVPFKCRVVGLRVFTNTASGDFNFGIEDDGGSELSSSETAHDVTNQITSSVNGASNLFFDNPVTLSPATWYRAYIEPSSATNSSISLVTLGHADHRQAMPGGTNFYYSAYTGTWADTTTSVPFIDLMLDQLDDGVGGGGGGLAGNIFRSPIFG